ncbi:MAG: AraC family transcriptional regulator [Clostridia bacterium]|nr:AraC family transcriptional regulator [Clostridia bacterium]
MEYNICKFNINASSDLICDNFVYETKLAQSETKTYQKHVLGLVVAGEGLLCKAKGNHPLPAGSLFVLEKGERFSLTGRNDLRYIYICFSGRRAEELLERIGFSVTNCVFEGYGHLADFWLDCLKSANDSNIDLLTEAVVLYSFSHLRPDRTKQSDLLTRIVALTNERFTKFDFSLSALAAELGYDPKYLSAFFKKQKGVAFTAYLRDLRIRRAIFLMDQGVVSVKNIALLSGFSDALYFSRVFKESEGISPKSYLELLQEKNG